MDRKSYKVTVLGGKGVGKTTLVDRICLNAKHSPSLGPNVRTLVTEDADITFCDIKMREPDKSFYQDTNAFIFVYDQSNIEASFLEMTEYIKEVVALSGKSGLMQIPHCVVLTKPDLPMSMDHPELLFKHMPESNHMWMTHTTVGTEEEAQSVVNTLLLLLSKVDTYT